jgi:ATP-dependent DNA helicase RecG
MGSGTQVALMAPTEILAEQHWLKLRPWLEPLGVRVAWLTGSLRGAQKRAVRAAIASGEVDLAIGTHALVEETTAFPRLGLAIVDEQHRFGVAQRLALVGENSLRAHLLMMSATPIPRTLAMSYCADLDLSVIDELPPGRTPVVTRVIDAGRRDEVAHRVRQAVADGLGRGVEFFAKQAQPCPVELFTTAAFVTWRNSMDLGPCHVGRPRKLGLCLDST